MIIRFRKKLTNFFLFLFKSRKKPRIEGEYEHNKDYMQETIFSKTNN